MYFKTVKLSYIESNEPDKRIYVQNYVMKHQNIQVHENGGKCIENF